MLKPLPKSVTVRGLDFRVILTDLGEAADATCEVPKQVIRVSTALSRDGQWAAFIHELLEAASDDNNLLLPDHGKLSVLSDHLFAALKSAGMLGK